MSAKEISVITVCFNAAKTIRDTINSILQQEFEAYEYIIIDGGSTDGTISIIKEYSSQVKWISEKDKGIYDAMNKGIKVAQGHFIYFINAGDTLLKFPIDVLKGNRDADLICFPVLIDNKSVFYPSLTLLFNIRNTLPHQGCFYKRQEILAYSLEYSTYSDYHLNLRYYKTEKKIIIVHNPVVAMHSSDGISNNSSTAREAFSLIRKENGYHWMILSFIYFKIRGLWYRVYNK